MAEFASLWVGKPLSKIEQTCLASFVAHGHTMNLFVYDKKLKVPSGVIKHDAREILPKRKIFKVDNSYGPFADMFRYKMIQETGLVWTDTDNICLKPNWKLPAYAFGLQGGGHGIVANGLLKAPKDSELVKDLVQVSSSYNKKDIVWGEIGPNLLTEKIKKYKLERFIKEPSYFYPVNYWQWQDLFDPSKKAKVLRDSANSYTIQIWNQMLNRENFDKNGFPEGSVMDYFYNKFVVKGE